MSDLGAEFHACVARGEACPRCCQRIRARRTQSFGLPIFCCPHCDKRWFNLWQLP